MDLQPIRAMERIVALSWNDGKHIVLINVLQCVFVPEVHFFVFLYKKIHCAVCLILVRWLIQQTTSHQRTVRLTVVNGRPGPGGLEIGRRENPSARANKA